MRLLQCLKKCFSDIFPLHTNRALEEVKEEASRCRTGLEAVQAIQSQERRSHQAERRQWLEEARRLTFALNRAECELNRRMTTDVPICLPSVTLRMDRHPVRAFSVGHLHVAPLRLQFVIEDWMRHQALVERWSEMFIEKHVPALKEEMKKVLRINIPQYHQEPE